MFIRLTLVLLLCLLQLRQVVAMPSAECGKPSQPPCCCNAPVEGCCHMKSSVPASGQMPVVHPVPASLSEIVRPTDIGITVLSVDRPSIRAGYLVPQASSSHALPPLVRSGIFLI